MNVEVLGRTFIWKDMGNFNDLLDASIVKNLQENQGFMVTCIEEISFNQKWIDEELLMHCVSFYNDTAYGRYLKSLM